MAVTLLDLPPIRWSDSLGGRGDKLAARARRRPQQATWYRSKTRPLGNLPDEVAVSVVTLSELRHGVLAANDHRQRTRRLSTLEAAKKIGMALVIDEAVGDELARLRVELEAIGRAMKVTDAWIAATAMAYDAAVCTRDTDFDAAADAGVLEVVPV